ncbi:MAG: glycoside hydrolase family 127 protein [Halanaerobiales bacterium]|nr:glycoside hydrolase family 127 protein [Halanaerobiales bacterium]
MEKEPISEDNQVKSMAIANIKFKKGFWYDRIELIRKTVIPGQWKALNDQIPEAEASHAIENFRIAAGEIKADFYGRVFQDSDVAKWLEAVSYSLAAQADPELEKLADQVIDLIVRAQQADGYLNTYFTIAEPDQRWKNVRDLHELYCAGHLIEAAVAYYQATGKQKLLDAVCKLADHIDTVFGKEAGKKPGYPGHQEIELALVKLYHLTKNKRYLALSQYFIDQRGSQPHFFTSEAEERQEESKKHYNDLFDYSYSQSHLPVREQTVAVGHAVRAMYMYCAMTDLAVETGEQDLIKACQRLWNNVTKRQMYITGGIGAQDHGEAFTFDYDLPNDTAYTETCAAIGLVFWAQRMLLLEAKAEYADLMEKALYNGVLSGISLDGQSYFYVNPLEVWPASCEQRYDLSHVESTRQEWFGCACCPPNIARLIASLGQYVYSFSRQAVFVHLYTACQASFELGGQTVKLTQQTNYPWEEEVIITVSTEKTVEFTLALRLPGWCKNPDLELNGEKVTLDQLTEQGYAQLTREWEKGDQVVLRLPMPVERIRANPEVRKNSGKVALQRGPLVYCLEEVDNGSNIFALVLPRNNQLQAGYDPNLLGGIVQLEGEAVKIDRSLWNGELYQANADQYQVTPLKAIPYYAWNNREAGEMLVWITEN